METIEQLQEQNSKLQERLNNAAKFFREQKATIEKLTEEAKDKDVEIANQKDALESCYKQLHDLEMMTDSLNKENEELKRKPQDDYVSPEKWNALVTEKEVLNEQLNEYELKLQASEKSYEELKELHDGDLKRYNELEDNYEELQNKYNDLDKEFESFKNNVDEQENDLIKDWREKYNREVQEKEALKTFIKENYDKFQKYLQELQNELVQKFKDNSNNNQHPNKSTMVLNSTGNQFMSDAPGLNI